MSDSRTAYFLSGPLKGQYREIPGALTYVKAPVLHLDPARPMKEEDVVPDYEDSIGRIETYIYEPVGKYHDLWIFDVCRIDNAR